LGNASTKEKDAGKRAPRDEKISIQIALMTKSILPSGTCDILIREAS
jgi:hypothetical protein